MGEVRDQFVTFGLRRSTLQVLEELSRQNGHKRSEALRRLLRAGAPFVPQAPPLRKQWEWSQGDERCEVNIRLTDTERGALFGLGQRRGYHRETAFLKRALDCGLALDRALCRLGATEAG